MKIPAYNIEHLLGTSEVMQEFARLYSTTKGSCSDHEISGSIVEDMFYCRSKSLKSIFCFTLSAVLLIAFILILTGEMRFQNNQFATLIFIGTAVSLLAGIAFIPPTVLRKNVQRFIHEASLLQHFIVDRTGHLGGDLLNKARAAHLEMALELIAPRTTTPQRILDMEQGFQDTSKILSRIGLIDHPDSYMDQIWLEARGVSSEKTPVTTT